MAIFPHLEHDEKVQVNDKIRILGAKSFVPAGTTAISTMTVKPYEDIGSAISIYNATVANRYLDWSYAAWKMDIDSTNNKINFTEGGSDLEATLSSGTYTLVELATEIATQMSAEGANTYSVDVSDDDELTISANGGFSLVPRGTNILRQLGFYVSTTQSLSNAESFTGKRVRYLTRRVTLTVGNGMITGTSYGYVKLYSEEGDNLFSSDSDLVSHEPDLMSWLPAGKNSYKYAHRRAQEMILGYLDEKGYTDHYKNKLLIDAIVDIDEVKEWSKFLTLRLIFKGFINATDDVFTKKADSYLIEEKNARNRAVLRLDLNGDGVIEQNSSESIFVSTISCARR
jgi:hypothetical protein